MKTPMLLAAAPLALTVAVAAAACSPPRPTINSNRTSAQPAAPPPARGVSTSHVELVRYGQLVGRITTNWSRTESGTPVRRSLLTLYRERMAPLMLELPLPDPTGRMRVGMPASPAIFRHASDAGGPTALHARECANEYAAMFDAIDTYWAANDALGACAGGPLGCFGASMSLLQAWASLGNAGSNLSSCLKT